MTGPLELDALDVSGDTVVTSAAFASLDWEWLSPHAPATNAPIAYGMMMSFRMRPPPGEALARAPVEQQLAPVARAGERPAVSDLSSAVRSMIWIGEKHSECPGGHGFSEPDVLARTRSAAQAATRPLPVNRQEPRIGRARLRALPSRGFTRRQTALAAQSITNG